MSRDKPELMLTHQDSPLAMLHRELDSLRDQLAEAQSDRDENHDAMVRSREQYHECNGALCEALRERDAMRETILDMIDGDEDHYREVIQPYIDKKLAAAPEGRGWHGTQGQPA